MVKTLKNEFLSEQTLQHCLEELRCILQTLGNGLLFFDINSFYAYIGYYMNETDSHKALHLLSVVEPYIPIIVSDDNIDTFLEAALRNDVNEVVKLEARFISDSKMRFVQSITAQKDDETWRNTVDTCQTIRKYKVEGVFALS